MLDLETLSLSLYKQYFVCYIYTVSYTHLTLPTTSRV